MHRSTRHLALTEAGAAFHDRLKDINEIASVAERAGIHHQKVSVGRLRISAPPDLGTSHLTPVIARFVCDRPDTEIELELSNTAVNLIERTFDLAMCGTLQVDDTVITR